MNTPSFARITFYLVIGAALGPLAPFAAAGSADRGLAGSYISIPDVITAGETRIEAERGLLIVPENRANPESRLIAVPFLRFAALAPQTGARRPPVVLLAGGPGDDFDFQDAEAIRELQSL